jgi:molecular chaperone DnaK
MSEKESAADKAIREALASVERLEREKSAEVAFDPEAELEAEAAAVEVLSPGDPEIPPSGDPASASMTTPPAPADDPPKKMTADQVMIASLLKAKHEMQDALAQTQKEAKDMFDRLIIGIDLGTTNSCVAVMEGGEPVVIPNAEGARTTPSMVAFTDERRAARRADRQAAGDHQPRAHVFAVKRLIGRKFDSPEEVQRADRQLARTRSSPRRERRRLGRGARQAILAAGDLGDGARQDEADRRGLPRRAGHRGRHHRARLLQRRQRQATKDAGRIAGLDVLRIINEPTGGGARLRPRQEGRQDRAIIAVYDLGGGTFDISILELGDGVFEVKATNGDTFLGGEDFDQRIVDWLADEFKSQTASTCARQDGAAAPQGGRREGQARAVSSLETEINLPVHRRRRVGPEAPQRHADPQQARGAHRGPHRAHLEPCEIALATPGSPRSEIDEVILVGGMTRMPAVQEKVAEFFGKRAAQGRQPRRGRRGRRRDPGRRAEGRGQGRPAARRDAALARRRDAGRRLHPHHRQEHHHPRKSQVFSTAVDNQPSCRVHVLQGEREMAADNKTLARFELVGIPPAPRGVPQIEVTFDIDANGIVHVSAKDLGTGKQQTRSSA